MELFLSKNKEKLDQVLVQYDLLNLDWQFYASGDHYDVYTAKYKNKQYILRLKNNSTDYNEKAEGAIWQHLSSCKFSPYLFHFESDFSLSTYGGRPIQYFSSYKMSHFLARFHTVPHAHSKENAPQLDWAVSYPNLWAVIQKSQLPNGLCHGDLLPGNILISDHSFLLIDFQFSHFNSPLIDLVALVLYWRNVDVKCLLKNYYQLRSIKLDSLEKKTFCNAAMMVHRAYSDYILNNPQGRFGMKHLQNSTHRLRKLQSMLK